MKKLAKVLLMTVFVGVMFIINGKVVFAFCVYNETPVVIKAWEDPGDFSKTIVPGSRECCHWTNKDCNPAGSQTATLALWLDSQDEDSHFSAILPMQAGGYAVVKAEDRSQLGVDRQNLFVESYTYDHHLIVRSPYGIGATTRDVHFLVTADPHYFEYHDWKVQLWPPHVEHTYEEKNRRESDAVFNEMVQRLAASCTSTTYLGNCAIRGIIVAGDLTHQSRDKELSWYRDGGIQGAVRFVYDGYGNHDAESDTIKDFILKDRRRETVATGVQAPHYSWDWHDVHFVQLNLFPGNEPSNNIDPEKSLDFLENDLREQVRDTNRPVVIIHHYGFDGFSTDYTDDKQEAYWWTEAQRLQYWEAIKNYNVQAIFTGHVHLSKKDKEDKWHIPWLRPKNATGGPASFDTFVAGAAKYGVFLDVYIQEETLTVERWIKKPDKEPVKSGEPVTIDMRTTVPTTYIATYENYDAPGNDYESIQNATLALCTETCNADTQCVAMTLNKAQNTCWLKGAVGKVAKNSDGILGLKTLNMEYGVDRRGNDYRSFAATAEQCSQICYRDSACRAFTFNLLSNTCWLKNSVPRPVPSYFSVSGHKE